MIIPRNFERMCPHAFCNPGDPIKVVIFLGPDGRHVRVTINETEPGSGLATGITIDDGHGNVIALDTVQAAHLHTLLDMMDLPAAHHGQPRRIVLDGDVLN